MPVSGFGGTCYEGACEKTPNFEKKSIDFMTETALIKLKSGFFRVNAYKFGYLTLEVLPNTFKVPVNS